MLTVLNEVIKMVFTQVTNNQKDTSFNIVFIDTSVLKGHKGHVQFTLCVRRDRKISEKKTLC